MITPTLESREKTVNGGGRRSTSMRISRILKDYIKAALAGGFLLSVVASMIAGGFFWDPAWRRDPSSPIRTFPVYGGVAGIIAGLLLEFRTRKNSFKKNANRKD